MALLFLVISLNGCLGQPAKITDAPIGVAGPRFLHPIVVNASIEGFEPALAAGRDAWYVCSINGVGRGTNVFRSLDGVNFTYLGLVVPPGGPALRSGTGDVGGGDCDIAADGEGNVYLADLWGGSVSFSASSDQGSSWKGTPLTIVAPNSDRPWVAAGASAGSIFLTAAQIATAGFDEQGLAAPPPGGIWVARSSDGGRTFVQSKVVDNARRTELNGNIAQGPDGTLYVPFSINVTAGRIGLMMGVSRDGGATWEHRFVAEQSFPALGCSSLDVFPVVAAGSDGVVFVAWVLDNAGSGRLDLFVATSTDQGRSWSRPFLVTDRAGTRLFPWMAAPRLAGGVGIAWYEANRTMRYEAADPKAFGLTCDMPGSGDADWYLHYARVSLENGTLRSGEALVQPAPVHHGSLDRPYAERLGVAFDGQGRAGIAYVADVPQGAARPMFALQDVGPGSQGPGAPSSLRTPGAPGVFGKPGDVLKPAPGHGSVAGMPAR